MWQILFHTLQRSVLMAQTMATVVVSDGDTLPGTPPRWTTPHKGVCLPPTLQQWKHVAANNYMQ